MNPTPSRPREMEFLEQNKSLGGPSHEWRLVLYDAKGKGSEGLEWLRIGFLMACNN